MLITLFCRHKATGEVWDPWRLVIHCANHAVLHAQNDRWGLGTIETINSGRIVAVVNAQKLQMRDGIHRDKKF